MGEMDGRNILIAKNQVIFLFIVSLTKLFFGGSYGSKKEKESFIPSHFLFTIHKKQDTRGKTKNLNKLFFCTFACMSFFGQMSIIINMRAVCIQEGSLARELHICLYENHDN